MAKKGKFKSLIHNGVVLPPDYEPKGYKLNGELIPNTGYDSAEEMLWHYSAYLSTDYVKAPVFNPNFYSCLRPTLSSSLSKLRFPDDFMPVLKQMSKDHEKEKESKAEYRKTHKEELEKEKNERAAFYGIAQLDGKDQPVAYVVEGPGIFIARGEAPLLGMWKYRTKPEDITINYVGPKGGEPKAPEGHKWGCIEHNTNAMHIALYKVNVGNKTEKIKELRFGNTSDVKANADQKKFAKAAKLLCHMKEMEAHIRNGMESSDEKRKQCAVACWLIMNTGIRVGGEKDESIEADTHGITTLTVSDVKVNEGALVFDFFGKDSIRYQNTVSVPKFVSSYIKSFCKGKKSSEQIFNLIDAADINKFLSECIEGVTAKTFRTSIASMMFIDAFKKQNITKSATLREKLNAFDMANLEVAKKLNHKRAISKNFDSQLERLDEQVKVAIEKEKQTTSKVKASLKKIEAEKERANKLLEGEALKVALKNLKDMEKKEKEKLEKAKEKVSQLSFKKDFKSKTMDVAIGTSKTNYITPLIAYSICNYFDIPISKIYTKTLQEKYKWAEKTSPQYWKKYPNV